jgi:hypothetical protein
MAQLHDTLAVRCRARNASSDPRTCPVPGHVDPTALLQSKDRSAGDEIPLRQHRTGCAWGGASQCHQQDGVQRSVREGVETDRLGSLRQVACGRGRNSAIVIRCGCFQVTGAGSHLSNTRTVHLRRSDLEACHGSRTALEVPGAESNDEAGSLWSALAQQLRRHRRWLDVPPRCSLWSLARRGCPSGPPQVDIRKQVNTGNRTRD